MGCNSSRVENPQKQEKPIEDLVPPASLAGSIKVNFVHTPNGSKTFANQTNPKTIHSPSFSAIAEQVSRKQSAFSSQSESETDTPGKLSKVNSLEHFRKKTQEAKNYLQRFLKKVSYLEGVMENISKSPKGAFNSSVFEAPLAENGPEDKQNISKNEFMLILEDFAEMNSAVNSLSQKFTTISTDINKLLAKGDSQHNDKEEQKVEIDEAIIKNEIKIDEKEQDLQKENIENNEIAESECLKDEEESKTVSSIISNIFSNPACEEINEKNVIVEKSELNEEAAKEQPQQSENASIDSAPEMINKSRVIASKLFNVTTKQPGKSKIGTKLKVEIDTLANPKPQLQPIITPKRNSDIASKLPQFFTPANKSPDEPQRPQTIKASSQVSQIKLRSSEDSINLNAFGALKKQVETEIGSQKPKSRIQKMSFGNNHPRSLSARSND